MPKPVVVTRPGPEAREWVRALQARGHAAIALPLIEIAPAPDAGPLRSAWAALDACRAVMFVSGNAVRAFFARREGAAWPSPGPRAWAPGPGTRAALIGEGVPAEAIDAPPADAPRFDSESLWQVVAGTVGPGDRVLLVRGGDDQGATRGREWLAERLAEAGAHVTSVMAYVRQAACWSPAQQALGREAAEGVWLFSSSEAVANLRQYLPQQDFGRAWAVATHPRIARAARDAGFGHVVESHPDVEAVAASIESIR